MRALLLRLALCVPGLAVADSWEFSDPITVAGATGAPHYHHLDGAGRRHVATSEREVALVWEDDRSGAPQIYFAAKPLSAASFDRTFRLSTGNEAYEPALTRVDGTRWLVAWEQDGVIAARVIDPDGPGPVALLTPRGARQVTLASNPSGPLAAVWSRGREGGQLIEAASLKIEKRIVALAAPVTSVASTGGHPFQGYPTATLSDEGLLIVAWEDRRAGHTRIYHSWREPETGFAAERQLNEHNAPTTDGREVAGLGSGVMRATMAAGEPGVVRTIWLDKRNPSSGYAVWGATSTDGGRTFGPNQMVQDDLGASVPQWHPSLTGRGSLFVAAWDDTREAWSDSAESGDVILSWHNGAGWSPDLVVPHASGEGYQGSPAIALDPRGDLHLIWIERDDLSSPSRLRYMRGELAQ